MAPKRSRSPILWLAVLLALAGALAVALDAQRGGDVGASGGRDEQAGAAGEMLVGEGAAADAPAGGPRLAGLAAERRETHGPVEVRVVDLGDAPAAGMLVSATWKTAPAEDGGEPQTHWQQAITDALGRARFSDLPYDGTARVAAHLRAAGWGLVEGSTLPPSAGVSFTIVTGDSEAEVAQAEPGTLVIEEGRVEESTAEVTEVEEVEEVEVVGPTSPLDETTMGLEDPWGETSVWAAAVVRGPEVTLRIDAGLPLRVEVREGGTGRLHPEARWKAAPRIAWDTETWGAATLPVRRGEVAAMTLEVEAPRGTVARSPAQFLTFIHPQARRLEAVYPVRPEARILVVFPPEVQPFRPEDWNGRVTLAGMDAPAERQRFDGEGRLVVEGAAWLAGELVSVEGNIGGRFTVTGQAALGASARDLVLVAARASPIPATPIEEASGAFAWRLAGGMRLEVRMNGLSGVLRSLVVNEGRAPTPPAAEARPPRSALRVTVLTPGGLPAPGAVLHVRGRRAVADAQGVALIEGLRPGGFEVHAVGVGAGATATGHAPQQGTLDVTLRAHLGGTLEVEVVDDAGRGLPYATLSVTQPQDLPWIDLDGDVQRLDPYTDASGRRTLRTVALGKVKLDAAFGSRSASAEVQVTEGGVQTVRLVLPSVPLPSEPAPATGDGSPPR